MWWRACQKSPTWCHTVRRKTKTCHHLSRRGSTRSPTWHSGCVPFCGIFNPSTMARVVVASLFHMGIKLVVIPQTKTHEWLFIQFSGLIYNKRISRFAFGRYLAKTTTMSMPFTIFVIPFIKFSYVDHKIIRSRVGFLRYLTITVAMTTLLM